jgi:hypothetical protein
MYLATVACEISIPSFNSSPWIRGAPHRGLARVILRIRFRTSPGTEGRPLRFRLFHLQYRRKPFRCQAITVSGLTISSADRQSAHKRESQTHLCRSVAERLSRRPRLERCRTKSWCRSARISACKTARVRKQPRRANKSEKNAVNMGSAAHFQQRFKFNFFNVDGVFGRDSAKTFGSPAGEPNSTTNRPRPQQVCEKLWTLPSRISSWSTNEEAETPRHED